MQLRKANNSFYSVKQIIDKKVQ